MTIQKSKTMSCPFCDEVLNPAMIKYYVDDWPYGDRLIYSNASWIVVPGYSPQVYPYILIISKKHYISFFQCSVDEINLFYECLDYLLISKVFKRDELLYFEHGGNLCGGSCIEHCHIHVIGAEVDVLSDFKNEEMIRKIEYEEGVGMRMNENYLLCAQYGGESDKSLYVSRHLTRDHQYFRKMIGRIKGDDKWDWHLGINIQYMIRLYDEFKKMNS